MSATLHIERIVCPRCRAVLDVGDRFCRHCGAPTAGSPPPPVPAATLAGESSGKSVWSESRWVVLAVLFLGLGPLGLPMLWRSRSFSPAAKAILTIVVVGATAALVGMICYLTHKTLQPLMQLRELHHL